MRIARMLIIGFVVHVVVALAACSSNDVTPQQACLDLADARADAASRCGIDYDEYYAGYLQGAAKGDCANVSEVRDYDELYQECLPKLDDLSCDAFDADDVPAACTAQLGSE